MTNGKLTAKLAEHVEKTLDGDMLEIIVEFDPARGQKIISGSGEMSRQDRMTKLREDFAEQAANVAAKITGAGGEILGEAWINKTLKARVPVESIGDISDDDEVAALDLPEKIQAES